MMYKKDTLATTTMLMDYSVREHWTALQSFQILNQSTPPALS